MNLKSINAVEQRELQMRLSEEGRANVSPLELGVAKILPSTLTSFLLEQNGRFYRVECVDQVKHSWLENNFSRNNAVLTEILSKPQDGQFLIKVVFFNGTLLNMGKVEIGVNEKILATVKRKKIAPTLKELTDWILERCQLTFTDREQTKQFLSRLTKSWRFPLYTVWRGHSLSDMDIPFEFKKIVKSTIVLTNNLLQSNDFPQSIKFEVLFFLSCLNVDMPENGIQQILRTAKQKSGKERTSWWESNTSFLPQIPLLANAVGNNNTDWQHEIVEQVFKYYKLENPKAIQILANACWRYENFIFNIELSKTRLRILQNILHKQILGQ